MHISWKAPFANIRKRRNNKILQEKPDQLKKMLGLTNPWLVSEPVQDKEKYFKMKFKYALADAERT